MKITKELVLSWGPCPRYTPERLDGLLAGREGLTAQEIAELDISCADRIWVLLRTLSPMGVMLFMRQIDAEIAKAAADSIAADVIASAAYIANIAADADAADAVRAVRAARAVADVAANTLATIASDAATDIATDAASDADAAYDAARQRQISAVLKLCVNHPRDALKG